MNRIEPVAAKIINDLCRISDRNLLGPAMLCLNSVVSTLSSIDINPEEDQMFLCKLAIDTENSFRDQAVDMGIKISETDMHLFSSTLEKLIERLHAHNFSSLETISICKQRWQ